MNFTIYHRIGIDLKELNNYLKFELKNYKSELKGEIKGKKMMWGIIYPLVS
jgi:hypothetical protein